MYKWRRSRDVSGVSRGGDPKEDSDGKFAEVGKKGSVGDARERKIETEERFEVGCDEWDYIVEDRVIRIHKDVSHATRP